MGTRLLAPILIRRKHMGLSVGAYHFYNPKTDPVRQADFFINSVKLDSGDLPPVLDIEKRGKDENQLRRDLKLWLDKIEQHYKVKPILYTSYKFKTRYLNDSVFNSYPVFHRVYIIMSYPVRIRIEDHKEIRELCLRFRKLCLYLLYELTAQYYLADLRRISDLRGIYCFQPVADDYYRRHSFRFPDFEVVYAGSLSFWAGNTQLSR